MDNTTSSSFDTTASTTPNGDAHATLEVAIRWGNNVLAVEHLSPPRNFYLGDGPWMPTIAT